MSGVGVSDSLAVASDHLAERLTSGPAAWTRSYRRRAAAADFVVAAVSAAGAALLRFGLHPSIKYLLLSCLLPVAWVIALSIFGGYDARFIGTGSDEFRKVLNASWSLTAGLALLSYVANDELSRVYLLMSMLGVTMLDLVARYKLRKRLHRERDAGRSMSAVVAVGPEIAVADLITELRRERYHGLEVVAACLTQESFATEVAGVPVIGDLDDTPDVVRRCGAQTVAVLACPEINGVRLRQLAWELEKTDTDLCLAPALLDVAGPRTTVSPTAGLTLLYVDHPELAGSAQIIKNLFDRCAAGSALALLAPVMLTIALMIRLEDGGPALFKQMRVGKDGPHVPDVQVPHHGGGRRAAEGRIATAQRARRRAVQDARGSADHQGRRQAAQLVARRAAAADQRAARRHVTGGTAARAAGRGRQVRGLCAARLAVRPGLTGLWQINGRSDLSWDEAVRLDLRYVENWSLALDLLILWKTVSVMFRGSGAY